MTEIQLILASQSPRRRELLAGLNINFTVAETFFCDESYPPELCPEEVPAYLALKKSEAYPKELLASDVLLTADTVVIVDGVLLGKPNNSEDASRMLKLLSGKTHKVITAFCLRTLLDNKIKSVSSLVSFGELNLTDIEYYVHTYQPYDKAGAYGIQEWIGYVGVERIEGCFYNIVGLPVHEVYKSLNNLIKNN